MTATVPVIAPAAQASPAPGADATPDVVAPPPGHPRFPLIDSLRAIAALAVVLCHAGGLVAVSGAGFITHAEAGVALFFAISGFLLYRPFVSARLNGAPKSAVTTYLRRRVLRIVPAYWLALTLLAIWPGLNGVFTGHFWVFYGFGQVYDNAYALGGIGPAWTLCIEITFYLLLPVYAAAAAGGFGRLPRRRQVWAELTLLAAIGLASLAYRYILREHTSLSFVLNALPTHLDWFVPGMALAVLSAAWQDRPLPSGAGVIARRPAASVAVAVVAYAVVSLAVGGPYPLHLGTHVALLYTGAEDVERHSLYALAAIGLLIPAVLGSGGRIRRALSWRMLAWLGLISYGIYLWHLPVLIEICQPGPTQACAFHGLSLAHSSALLVLTAVGLIVAVACAAASYYMVERPILRYKR